MRRFDSEWLIRRTWQLAIVVAACSALSSATASAGTYTVTQTCGAWDALSNAPGHIAIYTECPALVLRNVGGPFNSTAGQEARWDFNAPADTSIERAYMAGTLIGGSGWQATILTNAGLVHENCPGASCPGGAKSYAREIPLFTPRLMLRLRCGADRCPNGEGLKGYLDVRALSMTIADGTLPGVGITGGDLLDGWRRGVATVTFDSSDNVGIRSDQILIDGVTRGQTSRPCADGVKYPCPNGPAGLRLDTTLVSDGRHALRVESVDSAGNAGGQGRDVLIDTPPAAAGEFASDAGEAWRSVNAFDLTWRNPRQAHAPIAGAEYDMCPVANQPADRRGCNRGSRVGSDLNSISDFTVPAAGAWRMRLWLRDAAGNHDPSSALETRLRFDDKPPTAVFLEQDSADPTRLRLEAADEISGLANAEIEARRQGEDSWRPLPAKRTAGGFSAQADDEVLPRGLYDLRAPASPTPPATSGPPRPETTGNRLCSSFPCAIEPA